jgi:integrase
MFVLAARDKRLSVDHVPTVHRLKEAEARQGFLEPAEFARLVDALPHYLKDPVDFLYHSAWRVGEMRSLEWRDVDGDVIRLRPENSKTGRGRTLVLAGELAAIVGRARDARRLDCPYVFHDGGQPIGDFRKAWRKALKYADLPRGFIVHDLRRSGVRNVYRATGSQAIAMAFSGHKTDAMFRRYNIISEAELAQAAADASEYVATRAKEPAKVVALDVLRRR